MVGDAGQFIHHHPDVLAPVGAFNAEQFFHRQGVPDIVHDGRAVIQPVGVGEHVGPGDAFAHFFETAVQIAHLDGTVHHRFAVQGQQELDRSVRRRMGGAHVEDQMLGMQILFQV